MSITRCLKIFETIGDLFNAPIDTQELLHSVARTVVEQLGVKGCHFRLLSRDQQVLEHMAAFGLSESFVNKGPVDAERSVAQALKGKTVAIHDCESDSRLQYPLEFVEEGIASLLTVPLQTRGQVIGVMRLFTAERRQFTEDELATIEAVASLCTSAITHSMFETILRNVTESIRTSLDLDEVLNGIVRVISDDLRAKGCLIQLLGESRDRLEVKAASGFGESFLRRLDLDPGAAAREALRGDTVVVNDARQDPRIPFLDEVLREQFVSMLYVPLVVRGAPIGVLCVVTHGRWDFSDDEVFLMAAVAEQCALAIHNAQMYASIRQRYDTVVEDFHQWFEHVHAIPGGRGA